MYEEVFGSGVQEIQEDEVDVDKSLATEIAKSNLSRRTGYDWMSMQVTRQYSKYR